jgi:2'-hydroxyisoflavone reductase
MHESGPVVELPEGSDAALSLGTYGALKVACERTLEQALPGRVLQVRAGLMIGPHDYDQRFRWWLQRIARGGEVLAPGDPEALAQAIDVRDIAAWMVAAAEAGRVGAFNVTGEPLAMRELLETLRLATGSDARFVWVPDEILLARQVAPYSDLPFWLPASLAARPVDIRLAVAEGLSFRPLLETARDTWAWLQAGWDEEESVRRHRTLKVPAGISTELELELLAENRLRQTAP